MNWKHTALIFGYFAFFFLSVFAIFWWGRRQRRTRAPFAKDLRLLRGPGETQLKILRGLEESFPLLLLITGLAPVFAVIVLLEVVRKLNAKWLKEWLNKVTAEKIEVTPVLNFPGWYVEANAAVSLRVINSSWLPSVLAGDGHIALSEKQIDLISRQLEQRCRDVQY